MSNNIDKFNKKEIQIAPTQTGATTQTHAHNNTLNIGNELNGSSNNNTLATLLNSEEFIALSYEEKIAKLQELYPQLKPAEIANILPKENIEDVAENIMIEEAVDETEAPASQFDGVKVFQFGSGMMSSADTFDRNEILEGIDDASKELKDSPDWDKKSPAEKLNDRLDAYLATKVGHYDKLDEEDKQDEREHLIAQITDNENFEQLSDIDKLYETLNLARDFEMLESEEGFSIRQYLEMQENNPEDFKSLRKHFADKAIEQNFINNDHFDIYSEKWTEKSLDERLLLMSGLTYKNIDPNLDIETLKKLSNKFADEMAQRHGITGEVSQTDKLLRDTNKQHFIDKIEALKLWNSNHKDNPLGFTDLKDPRILADVMISYEGQKGIELSSDAQLYRDVVQTLDGKAVTGRDIYNHLKNKKINKDELSTYEEEQLKFYEKIENDYKNGKISQKEYDTVFTNSIKDPSETIAYKMNSMQSEPAEKVEQYCRENGLLPEDFDTLSTEDQKEYLEITGKIIQYFNDNNITPEKFKKLSSDEQVRFLNELFEGDARFTNITIKVLGLSDKDMQELSECGLDFNIYNNQIDRIDDANKKTIVRSDAIEQCGSHNQYRRSMFRRFTDDYRKANSNAQQYSRRRLQGLSGEVSQAQFENGWTPKEMAAYGTAMANDNKISTENAGNYISYTQEHAPNDEFRYEFGTGVAQNTTNPDILEYLGAATQYFESDNYRYQYINTLTTVAQNYSPEVQQAVQTAIQTGTVSNTNVVEAEALSVSRSANSTSSSTAAQASAQGNAQPASAPAQSSAPANAPSAAAATPIQNTAAAQETQQGLNYTPSSVTINPVTFSSRYDDEVSVQASDKTNKTTPASSNSKVDSKKIDDAKWVEEANAKKQETLDKIAEVKQAIDDAKEEWEIKHQLQLTDEEWKIIESELAIETAVDGLDDTKMPQTEKSRIIAKLKAATSFNERFNILLSAFGKRFEDRFIERLASRGSVDRINEFLSHRGTDTNILKTLYLRCSGEGIKKELLGMLPSETVEEMLASGDITNIGDVNYKIIQSYVLKNIYSMSNSDFTKYLKYLPLDIREKLTEERNIARGNINNPIKVNGEAHQADMPSVVTTQSTKPQNNTTADKKAQQPMSQANGLFKNGETTVKLADGRFATKNGTSFGAISDNDYSDSYRIIDPKEEGAPIGMNDEVLTPGSVEWNKKYNHNNVAATSFTMAALDNEEESDDFGIPFGSNKVGMGKKIKKKYKPGGFNTKG